MRLLITGAAGVLGSNLVKYLHKHGDYDIVGTDVAAANFSESVRIDFHQADLRNRQAISSLMKDVETVVHCASAAPSFGDKEIFEINVDGTKLLLDTAYNSAVKRFVYVSSTAVYGIPSHSPIDEDDELQPYHDAYNKSKVAAEQVCKSYRQNGLVVPVLRPRTFLGPGRLGTFAMLNDWASNGHGFPMLGNGNNRYQFLDVEDLCQAIMLCLTHPDDVVNDTFNVGAEQFTTMKEDYQVVLDRAGFGKKIVAMPAYPILLVLGALERLSLSPLYGRLYKKLQIDYYVSIQKAKDRLGFKPQYSNAQSLVRCYDWYVQNKELISQKPGLANNAPWKQGVLRLGKCFF